MAIDRPTAERITTEFVANYPGALALAYKFRDTVDELYGEGQHGIPQTAKGAHLSRHVLFQGRVYKGCVDVVLGNVQSEDDMLETLRHEVIGHYGINTFQPEERRALLDALIAARDNPGLKEFWANINNRYGDQALYVQAEEVWALYCEKLPLLYHADNDHARVLGEQSFRETCADRSRPMRLDDLHNIACMVAQGIRDRSREQQTFPQLPEHRLSIAHNDEPRTLDFGNRSLDELAQEYAAMEGTDGGRLIDVDLIRELSPEYRADRSRAQDVHAAASRFSQQLYERALAQPVADGRKPLVVFTAGGSGSGKSSAINKLLGESNADITFDGTFSKLNKARNRIQAALDSGRKVAIRYVFRAPEKVAKTAIVRAISKGRTVPVTVLAETNVQALQVVRTIANDFKDDERVMIIAIDNNGDSVEDAYVTDITKIPEVHYDDAKHKIEAAIDATWRQQQATADENARAASPSGVQADSGEAAPGAETDGARESTVESTGRLGGATIPGSPESGGSGGGRNTVTPGTLTPELYRAFMGREPPAPELETTRGQQADDVALFSRAGNKAAFYSALGRQVEETPEKALTGKAWLERVTSWVKKGLVKEDEVFWSGLRDWLAAQEGKTSRDSVQKFLHGGMSVVLNEQDETQYDKWSFAKQGGNYREVVLTLSNALTDKVRELEEERDDEMDTLRIERDEEIRSLRYERDKELRPLVSERDEELAALEKECTEKVRELEEERRDAQNENLDKWYAKNRRRENLLEEEYEEKRRALIEERREALRPLKEAREEKLRPLKDARQEKARPLIQERDEKIREQPDLEWSIKREYQQRIEETVWPEFEPAMETIRAQFQPQMDAVNAEYEQRLKDVKTEYEQHFRRALPPSGEENITAWYAQRIDAVRAEYQTRMDAVREKYQPGIDAIRDRYEQRIDAVEAKYQPRIDAVEAEYAPRIKAVRDAMGGRHNFTGEYRTSHWSDIKNSLAHLRLTDFDGDNTLFVEELQSDWAQDKRKGKKSVPDAPFVGSTGKWLDLLLKNVLIEAANGEYSRVSFVTGAQSSKRYDIATHVSRLTYDGKTLRAEPKEDDERELVHDCAPEQLADLVGEEVAARLLDAQAKQGTATLTGDDLHVTAAGMHDFYDKIVPRAMEKLLRKLDQKVTLERVYQHETGAEQWSFRVTPAMRTKLAEQGLPLFSRSRAASGGDAAMSGKQGVIDIPVFQRGWHGSPKRFRYFSSDHIGSGEGAQVHGWGLYVSLDRNTAQYRYKDRLEEGTAYYFNGDFVLYDDGEWIWNADDENEANALDHYDNATDIKILETAKENDAKSIDEVIEYLEEEKDEIENGCRKYEEEHWKKQNLTEEEKAAYEKHCKARSNLVDFVGRLKLKYGAMLSGGRDALTEEERTKLSSLEEEAKKHPDPLPKKEIPPEAREEIEENYRDTLEDEEGYEEVCNALEEAKKLAEEGVDLTPTDPGQLYEVDIPEDDVMLREEADLADQPQPVKQALIEILEKVEVFDEDRNAELLEVLRDKENNYAGVTGKEFYEELASGDAEGASRLLNKYGIKGIRYNGEQDGECAVIFDDEAIDIVDTYFSRARPAAETAGGVRRVVRQALQGVRNAPRVEVVETVADLPFAAPSDAQGAFHNGRVWLVAENLKSAQEAREVLAHEMIGHYGLRGFFGRGLDMVLNRIHANNARVRQMALQWRRDNADLIRTLEARGVSREAIRARSIEEALAQMAQAGEKLTGWKMLAGFVQNLLRKIGAHRWANMLEARTDAEALTALKQAEMFVRDGLTANDTIPSGALAAFEKAAQADAGAAFSFAGERGASDAKAHVREEVQQWLQSAEGAVIDGLVAKKSSNVMLPGASSTQYRQLHRLRVAAPQGAPFEVAQDDDGSLFVCLNTILTRPDFVWYPAESAQAQAEAALAKWIDEAPERAERARRHEDYLRRLAEREREQQRAWEEGREERERQAAARKAAEEANRAAGRLDDGTQGYIHGNDRRPYTPPTETLTEAQVRTVLEGANKVREMQHARSYDKKPLARIRSFSVFKKSKNIPEIAGGFVALAESLGWKASRSVEDIGSYTSSNSGKYLSISRPNPDFDADNIFSDEKITIDVRISDHARTTEMEDFYEENAINLVPSNVFTQSGFAYDTFESALWKLKNARVNERGSLFFGDEEAVYFSRAGREGEPVGNSDRLREDARRRFEARVEALRKDSTPQKAWQRFRDVGATKLSFEQWQAVRTDAFRDRFGDWEVGTAKGARMARTFAEAREKAEQSGTLAEETEDVARADQIVLQEMAEQAAAMHMEETMMNHSEQERAAREDVNAVDQFGRTQLGKAACREQFDVVRELLAAGANVNARDKSDGNSPLHWALERNHGVSNVMAARMLLAAGADVNARNVRGETPLHLAARSSNVDAVALLIAHGADVNAVINDARSAVELSLAYTPDVMGAMAVFADAPEEQAALTAEEDKEHAVYICEQKIGRTALDFEEWRAARTGKELMRAVRSGNIETARVLIEQGANVNFASETAETSMTVLMLAAKRGHTDIVRQLIENGADVNAGDKWEGVTALMYAIGNHHADIVRLLIESGADVNVVTTKNGDTALSLAEGWGDDDIVRLIKSYTKMDDSRARFQAAWHGSSHEFDAFSLDHVGQGGVPAHGWGLYFARDRATAESYRRPFAHDAAYLWDGDHIQVDGYSWVSTLDGERYDRDTPRGYALWALSEAGGHKDDALFNLEKERESLYEDAANAALDEIGRTEEEERAEQQWNEALESRDSDIIIAAKEQVSEIRRKSKERPEVQARAQELLAENEEYALIREAADALRAADVELAEPGRIYEVDVPEDNELLHKDAPLIEQPPQVRERLTQMYETMAASDDEYLRGHAIAMLSVLRGEGETQTFTAEAMYNNLALTLSSEEAASRALGEAGIPGWRYVGGLDGECFVIWNEEAVRIMETRFKLSEEARRAQMELDFDSPLPAVPTSVEDQAAAEVLNQTLARQFDNPAWQNAYQATALPPVLAGLRDEFQAAFGRTIRPVLPTEEQFDCYGGVYLSEHPGEVFVNVRQPVDFLQLAGHEMLHDIKRTRPDLYDWFIQQAERYLVNVEGYQERLNRLAAANGNSTHTLQSAKEELIADFCGDSLADVKFCGQLAASDSNRFTGLVHHVTSWLQRLGDKLRGMDSARHVKDVDGLRKHLSDVLVAYAKGEKLEDMPSYRQAQAKAKAEEQTAQQAPEEARRVTRIVPTAVSYDSKAWILTITTAEGKRYQHIGAPFEWGQHEASAAAAALERGDTDTLEKYGVALNGEDLVEIFPFDGGDGWGVALNNVTLRDENGAGVTFENRAEAAARARELIAQPAQEQPLAAPRATCVETENAGRWGLTITTAGQQQYEYVGAGAGWSQEEAVAVAAALERGDADTLERYGVALNGENLVELFSYTTGSDREHWTVKYNKNILRAGEDGNFASLGSRDAAIASARELLKHGQTQYGYILPEGGLPAAEEAPRHATCVPTQSQTGQWGLTISTEGGNRYHDVGATLGWSEEEARTTAAALERGDTDTLERYGVAVAGDDVVALSKDVMGGWNITHNTQYVRAWYGGGVVDFDSHAVAVAHARKMVAMFAADDGQKRHAACMPVFFGGFDKWGLTVITPAGRCFRGICSGAYSDWSEDKAIAAGEALERGDADTLERYGVALAGDDVVEVVGSADTYWCIRHNQEYVRVFGERLELKTRDEAIARARKLMTAALSQQQSAQPADVVAQETTGQSATQDALPNGHIEDFGEKLGRARKDMAVSFTVNYSNDELSCLPLSKTWPEQEIDAIEDQRIAAICHTLRANIPATKPKRSSRRAVWVDKVAAGREIMRDLLSGKMQADELLNDLQKLLDGKKLARKIQLLEHLPREYWPYIAKAEERRYAIWHRDSGTWERGLVVDAHSNGLSYLVVSHEFDDRTGDGAYDLAKIAEQMREKLKDVVAQRDEQPQAEKREAQFDVAVLYNSHTDEVFAHKKGDALKRPLKTWPVPRGDNVRDMVDEDVFPWIREHRDELAAAWEEIKARDNVGKADVRSAENRIREGKDWRNGQDATPEMFTEAFGFRGVEFGNWVKQGKDDRERQWMLNQAYDALHDLADVLDIPTQAISLNGSLGLGFGSRGRGGRAAAHFEPDLVVINLTKTQGAGSLAHEWFHALDNYFSRMRNNERGYITERPEAVSYVYKDELGQPYPWRQHRSDLEKLWKTDPDKRHREPEYYNPENWVPVSEIAVRPEMEVAFARLVEALDKSPMAKRAKLNDKGRKPYWSQTVERAARAFENYVITKLDERGHHNDYLANVIPPGIFVRAADRYPYLKPEEMPPVKEAFDTLFATAQTRETDKGVALFSINPQTYAHFEKRIESLLNGGSHERGTVVLDRSDVLGLLGYRDVPLRLHEKHAQDGRAWHDKMTVEDWKKVPFWLDDPALVYLDVKDRGRAQGEYPDNLDAETSTWRLVAIAPETVQGDPVVMVLQPNLEQTLRGKVAEFHLLITTYEKDNGDLPSVAWLAKRGLLRYFDEERAREVLPEMRNARTSSNRAERAGVQFPGQNPMKSGHNVILTEKDLAAWRHKQILQAEDTSDADAGDGVKFSIRSGGGVLDDAASWAIREEFAQACRELGLIVDAPIMDGNRHRVPVEGARAGRLDGSYRGFLDGRPAGNICNFKTGVSRNWTTQQNRPAMTYQQRQEMNKAIAEKQEQDAREQAQRYEAVAQFIAKKFPTCPPVQDATPYMRAKGICWHDGVLGGVRTNVDGQKTIIVIHDENGKPWSTQTIHPDGAKIFFKGGKISGCFHAVGGMNALGKAPSIVIAEGYATAASLAEVLEQPTVAALNAGNLKPVAEALRRKYPDKIIVIAGDDDFRQEAKNGCNPGREKAQAAAEAVGGVAVFPKFAPGEQEREGFTDFNDLAVKSKIGVLGCRHQVLHAVSQARYAATHPDEVAQQPRQRVPEPIRMCG